MEKRVVKPFVSVKTKDVMYKIRFLTGVSVKQMGQDLCDYAIKKKYVNQLIPYFKRAIRIQGADYPAMNSSSKTLPKFNGEIERISLMLEEETYEYCVSLAYALDCSVAKVVAMLVESSMKSEAFLNEYVVSYLNDKITPTHKKMLESILKDVNSQLDQRETLTSLLFYIVDKHKDAGKSVKRSVEEFVSRWTVT